MAKTAHTASGGAGHHGPIGKVVILYGTVKAISPDGTARVLTPNSPVFADDQIITESDGSVSLMLDGTPPIHIDLGRMSQLVLDEDVYGGPASAADVSAEADKVQQALLAGEQPIEPEAPAAGGEASAGGGHPTVTYNLTGEEVTPDSGAETRGIDRGQLASLEREAGDTSPIGGINDAAVDEDGLKWPFRGNQGGPDDDPATHRWTTGNLTYDFGDDGPAAINPFVWSDSGLEDMHIMSHGHELMYEIVDGTTLNAYYMVECHPYQGGDQAFIADGGSFRVDVFSLEVTNIATGEYKFILMRPLDNAVAGTEDDIIYKFGYTLTDGDGSTGTGRLDMLVDDDSPVVRECRDEIRTVDEDDINTCLSQGNWPNDGDWKDGSITGDSDWWLHDLFLPGGPATIWGSLAAVVSFGADGPADNPKTCGPDGFSFSENLSSLQDQCLTSKGADLSYKIVGNTLIGYVGVDGGETSIADSVSELRTQIPQDRLIFTLTLEGDGDYKFSLYDQLDHTYGDNIQGTLPIDFSTVIVATDFDGDPVTLEEGKFVINITDDVPTCAGYDVVITEDEQNADHGGINEHGDHLTGWVAGTIVNDASWGADEFGGVNGFNVGKECFDPGTTVYWDKYGNFLGTNEPEDGGGSEAKFISDSINLPPEPAASLIVNADGTYTFTLLNNMLLGQGVQGEQTDCLATVTVIGQDMDGDQAEVDLYLKVDDDVPTAGCTAATLDDEGLNGIPGGPGDVPGEAIVATGILPHNFGADGAGSVTLADMDGDHGKVGTENVVYHWSGDTLTAVVDGGSRNGAELFTVKVDPNSGEYTVTQLDNVLHQAPICIDTANYLSSTDLVKIKVGVSHNEDASNVSINHENAALFVSANGFGVTSNVDGGNDGRFNELNNMFGTHQSEVMIFQLQGDRVANTATVDLTYFYKGEDMGGSAPGDEKGVYSLFKDGHQVQGPTIFTADSTEGTFTLNISCAGGFDEIRLGAVTGSNDPIAGDSSDYYIKNITFDQPYENDAKVNLTYTVTDGDGDKENGTLALTFDDDVPMAGDVTNSLQEGSAQDTNLMIILDVSGSMSSDSGISGESRLEAAKDAIDKLIDEYDDIGNVKVRIVTFSSDADKAGSEWMDVATAKAYIATLTPQYNTNYDDALAKAQDAFDDPGKLGGAQNVSYFLSDGEPNEPWLSAGINGTEQGTWEQFLTDNDIKSYALGMGTGADMDELDPIAYNGVAGADDDANLAIPVDDFADLPDVLAGTVGGSTTGNILTNSNFGADGPGALKIAAISDHGTVYDTDSAGFDAATHMLTFTTYLGGSLAVNFATGDYTYTAPNVEDDSQEVIGFTIKDADGDAGSAKLTIDVIAADDAPVAYDNYAAGNEGSTAGTANLVLVIDSSGSISGTELLLMKDAVTHLMNDYGTSLSKVMLVDFDDSANVLTNSGGNVWMTGTEAIAKLSSIASGGNTDYDDAIAAVQNHYNDNGGPPAADHTYVYFLSDGEPTDWDGGNFGDITGSERTNWENFLSAEHVDEVYAVGVGLAPGGTTYLNQVAWSSDGNQTGNVFTIDSFDDLDATLHGTVPQAITGNVITDNDTLGGGADESGDDGWDSPNLLVSVEYNGTTHNFLDASDSVTFNLINSGGTVKIEADGDYTFTPGSDVTGDKTDTVKYTIEDSNGTTDSANLILTTNDLHSLVNDDPT